LNLKNRKLKILGYNIAKIKSRVNAFDEANLTWLNGGSTTRATPDSVMGLAAWYRGCQLQAGLLAGLPKAVYLKDEKGREKVDDSLNELLKRKTNKSMNAITWHELAMYSLLNYGNAVSVIEREKGTPIGLIPLDPKKVEVKVYNNAVIYEVENGEDRNKISYLQEEIFHVMAVSKNGYWGIDPITAHKENLGLSLSAQKSGKKVFDKGIFADKVLYKEGSANPETLKKIREGIEKSYGLEGSRVIPLDAGYQIKELNSPNLEAMQFIQTRGYQDKEIANILGIPISMINGPDPKYDNMEGFWINYVRTSLLPIVRKFEIEWNTKCLKESQKKDYYIKYDVTGLLEGDLKAQAEFIKSMVQTGVMTIAEARAKMESNYIDGTDRVLIQGNNMIPLDMIDEVIKNNGNNKQSGKD
jgi:HK97 family phage portal protein